MTRASLQACQYERLTNLRRWQIHPGSNHFCFNGHCITGRNLFGAILTVSLLSLTSTVWLIFIPSNLIILFIGLLLIIYTFIYFFRSMCTDPGIILRSTSLERSLFNQQYHLNRMTSDHLKSFIFDIEVNHMIVKCKYCITCQMIRPPRSSHCAICSNCISILDHHCPFLSTCIGMRNYRFFIFFLIFLLQTELFFFATSLIKILNNPNDRISLISSYFILILTGPGAIYTCNLLGYHCMISSRGLTTREDDKGIYLNSNPFSAKSWYLNLAEKFCTSFPPSAYGAHRLINQKEYRFIKENV